MKKITTHAWVQDNSGSYHKPGSDLTVDDKGAEGCITAKVAEDLVKSHNALAHPHHHSDKAAAAR